MHVHAWQHDKTSIIPLHGCVDHVFLWLEIYTSRVVYPRGTGIRIVATQLKYGCNYSKHSVYSQ